MEASDFKADSVLLQREVQVGPSSVLPLTSSKSCPPGLSLPICEVGAKMLAYCACISKIVVSLRSEMAEVCDAHRPKVVAVLEAVCSPREPTAPDGC